MTTEYSPYSQYIIPGKRVRIAIPAGDNRTFQESAQILSLSGDLVELQLSRDMLPAEAQITVGSMVEICTGSGGSGYRCRSIIVSAGAEGTLFLRLFGEVILNELREFFRIDVYLPLCLSVPPLQDPRAIKNEWQKKRAVRRMKDTPLHPPWAHPSGQISLTACDGSPLDSPHHPKAANISGGGLRVTLPDKLEPDTLVAINLFLPLNPPVIIDAVGQVITAARIVSHPESHYSTAFRFYHIDERDRDHIIQYITNEQLAQLRHHRKRLQVTTDDNTTITARKRVLAVAGISLLCLLILWLSSWVYSYYRHQPKSEIHRVFEKGLREYLEHYR